MAHALRNFISWQRRLCQVVEARLSSSVSTDGNRFFLDVTLGAHLSPGRLVYDVGGGRHPAVSAERKKRLRLTVTGVDIDRSELALAPAGTYDSWLVADVTKLEGAGDGDVVICQALLEHVKSTERALYAMRSLLKPGGLMLIFVPCRNALFARANLALPESFKRWLLLTLYPETMGRQGFRSYYDRCTPREFEGIARSIGMRVLELQPFFRSSYFDFFVPFYLLWRCFSLLGRALVGPQLAESFVLVLKNEGTSGAAAD